MNPTTLKTLRIASGLTVAEMAERLNVSRRTMEHYESGRIQGLPEHEREVCEAFEAFYLAWYEATCYASNGVMSRDGVHDSVVTMALALNPDLEVIP